MREGDVLVHAWSEEVLALVVLISLVYNVPHGIALICAFSLCV